MGYRAGKKSGTGLTFNDLVNQDLKNRSFRPVYVLSGEDPLRVKDVVERIRRDALDPAGADFNFHILQGDLAPIEKVIQLALSLPMLGPNQVIWVKNADKCLTDAAKQVILEKYIAKPVQETILIMTLAKADKRKKWVKLAQEKGFLFDFTPPVGEALVQWAQKYAQRANLPLGKEEAQILCDLVGSDLLGLKNEMDKLALLVEDRGAGLSSSEIRELIMDQAELEGYEITAHFEPGNAGEVLKTWFRLAEWGKSAHEIFPLISSRVRKANLLAVCRSEGLSNQQIGSLTATNPWSFRYLETLVQKLGDKGLSEALTEVRDCDRLLKSSPIQPELLLEKSIMKVCRSRD